jgi:hypothetical protein
MLLSRLGRKLSMGLTARSDGVKILASPLFSEGGAAGLLRLIQFKQKIRGILKFDPECDKTPKLEE